MKKELEMLSMQDMYDYTVYPSNMIILDDIHASYTHTWLHYMISVVTGVLVTDI